MVAKNWAVHDQISSSSVLFGILVSPFWNQTQNMPNKLGPKLVVAWGDLLAYEAYSRVIRKYYILIKQPFFSHGKLRDLFFFVQTSQVAGLVFQKIHSWSGSHAGWLITSWVGHRPPICRKNNMRVLASHWIMKPQGFGLEINIFETST